MAANHRLYCLKNVVVLKAWLRGGAGKLGVEPGPVPLDDLVVGRTGLALKIIGSLGAAAFD